MLSLVFIPSIPARISEDGKAQDRNAFISGHHKKSAAKAGIGNQPMSLIK